MAEENVRLSIPDKVKAQLWVAAAGHCEFNCCNRPLDRTVLTQKKLFMAQHAHIIGDSVHGPRGDAALSKKLSQDVSNLMLTCRDCHWEIDRLEDDYPVDLLRKMKKRHEDRVQRLYALDETKDSIAVILRHPIKRIHVPNFTDTDVHSAILANSDFCHAPGEHIIQLDYRSRATREGDPAYWTELVTQMKDDYPGNPAIPHGVRSRRTPCVCQGQDSVRRTGFWVCSRLGCRLPGLVTGGSARGACHAGTAGPPGGLEPGVRRT